MRVLLSRNRALLLGCAVVAVGCAPAGQPSSSEPLVATADPQLRGYRASDFPRVQELAAGVYSYEQLRSAGHETFTTVSLFVITGEGVVVADGQGSPAETTRLVDTIAGLTDQPITHVVVCSDHGDHTAGNAAFPADAQFIIHPTSAAALAGGGAGNADPLGDGQLRRPARLVDTDTLLTLGGRSIHVLFLGRAHTGGDLVVYLPAERILFMSETFMNRVFPAMRTAFPSEWIEMIERAQALDVDTYVPGHGFVDPAPILGVELDNYRAAIATVIAETRRLHAADMTADEAASQADFGEIGNWSLAEPMGPVAIRRVFREIEGSLPPR